MVAPTQRNPRQVMGWRRGYSSREGTGAARLFILINIGGWDWRVLYPCTPDDPFNLHHLTKKLSKRSLAL